MAVRILAAGSFTHPAPRPSRYSRSGSPTIRKRVKLQAAIFPSHRITTSPPGRS
jgi:hypothetical protein